MRRIQNARGFLSISSRFPSCKNCIWCLPSSNWQRSCFRHPSLRTVSARMDLSAENHRQKESGSSVQFGPYKCSWSEVFCLTDLSYALVNLKPIVPGHVLIVSRRVEASFERLNADEVADLWATAHKVGPRIRGFYGADALTYAIQDGKCAGQTVPHVHIHILPRKPGDFRRNDDVYDVLERTAMGREVPTDVHLDAEEERQPRSRDQMAEESALLRPLFQDISLSIPSSQIGRI